MPLFHLRRKDSCNESYKEEVHTRHKVHIKSKRENVKVGLGKERLAKKNFIRILSSFLVFYMFPSLRNMIFNYVISFETA